VTEAPASRRIVIAGAGIGGLTAALLLARAGFRVDVHERVEALSEVGAGLQISPNAARILIDLGLEASLDASIGRPEALVVRSGTSAEVLAEMALGDTATRRWGAPTWVVHRADLQRALFAAANEDPDIHMHLGSGVEGASEHARGLTVLVSRRGAMEDVSALALIAADGVRSKLRSMVTSTRPPRFSGRAAFRALINVEDAPAALRGTKTGLWLGPGAHLVHYPLRRGTLINIVGLVKAEEGVDDWATRTGPDEIVHAFKDFAPLARALIAIPPTWLRTPLYDRPPERSYASGAVALLGDAAHPMLPFLAQGASMAIEDAHVLARCLADGATNAAASLQRYSKLRVPRASRVQREARFNDTVFHFGCPASVARDIGLKLKGGNGLAERYDWLYGWKG